METKKQVTYFERKLWFLHGSFLRKLLETFFICKILKKWRHSKDNDSNPFHASFEFVISLANYEVFLLFIYKPFLTWILNVMSIIF